MTRTIHRSYDSWKLASPDDEWQSDDDRPERDPDADRDDYMDERLRMKTEMAAADPLAEIHQALDAYLDNRADVDDGIPNEAMRLLTEFRAALDKARRR